MTHERFPDANLDQLMTAWLDDRAHGPGPEAVLDAVLARTTRTRPLPGWLVLERWLPRLSPIPWRPILAAAGLILLLVATLLVVGSQPRVPPPFGPARNGALAFGNGDIFVRDAIDGGSRLIVGGPTFDFGAGFTRDGQRLTFVRRTAGTAGTPDERVQMFVAERDGSNAVPVTGPLPAPIWADFAPDSSFAVVTAGLPDTGLAMLIADLRHPGAPRRLEIGDPNVAASFPSFLGPTGEEIVFRGSMLTPAGRRHGLFSVRPDGTGLRPLTTADGTDEDLGYWNPQSSPDGRYIAYTAWDSQFRGLRTHLTDLETGADRIYTDVGRSEEGATFSPDGSRIVYVSYVADRAQYYVGSVDGGSRAVAVGPRYRYDTQGISLPDDAPNLQTGFPIGLIAPDGKSVIVADATSGESRLVDAATGGEGELLPWSEGDISGWQRLAP